MRLWLKLRLRSRLILDTLGLRGLARPTPASSEVILGIINLHSRDIVCVRVLAAVLCLHGLLLLVCPQLEQTLGRSHLFRGRLQL